jgi:drug/metabolite transporter (DMT)-like permease
MRNATLPITLILIGAIWLLVHFKLFPDRDWLIAVGLIAGGVSVLVCDGITKSSVVTGPMMMATGAAWWLHDGQNLTWSVLMPALLICLGVLMLVARMDAVPDQRPADTAGS